MTSTLDYEIELKKFLGIHGKYDEKNKKWKVPQFHPKVKTVWVKSEIGGFQPGHNEKGFYQNVFDGFALGPHLFPRCMFCNKDLEEIRKYNPRRRVIKFCSENCRKEYNRREKIRKHLGSDGLIWKTYKEQKFPQRKEMRIIRIGKKEERFKAKKRKSENS